MKGRLMPSTPIEYATFHDGIQGTLSTNWTALELLSKCEYKGAEAARVARTVAKPIQRARRSPRSRAAAAPARGRNVVTLRTG
jgi:hypothetical protein